jgi:hypothetical protein
MNQALLTCFLLADSARADQFVKGFREGTLHRAADSNWLLFAVAGLAIALTFYAFDRFYRNRRATSEPNDKRLFQDLCRAHNLSGPSVQILQRVARQAKLKHLTEIFLRPELLRNQKALSDRDQGRLEQLRGQLFTA